MTEVVPMERLDESEEVKQLLKKSSEEEGLYDIPSHPKMDYEDIFGEPESYVTKGLGKFLHKGITKVFGGAFNYVQSTIYYILVMITGLFLAFIWGLLFGVVIYFINWFIHPLYKCLYIPIRLISAIYRPVARTFIDPIFEGFGQCFSGIKAAVGVQVRGVSLDLGRQRPKVAVAVTDGGLQEVTSIRNPVTKDTDTLPGAWKGQW